MFLLESDLGTVPQSLLLFPLPFTLWVPGQGFMGMEVAQNLQCSGALFLRI